MPGVRALKLAAEEARDPDVPPPKAEEMKLWLLSEILEALRARVCRKGLSDIEARLHVAQCVDVLKVLRSQLHAQTHLITWHNSNSTGQRTATWSATLIGPVGDRIKCVTGKYRRTREALIALKAEARRKLAHLGSSKCAQNKPTNKKTTLSWIWTVGGGPGEAEAQLHESVRMEWVKAKARRDRWVEEVQLLREEIKWVLRMLRWTQGK
ncbi:hypothetical protein B0H16DRAFT_1702250 [Mycena metata]|uniref:Uncharacterized protein n=1 Tax=Mycena metata TaxID=1033252 RepID=A0AAD7H6U1_9AGAR|nr:hypothetical protein B0H16DRAFT_1702250 [Mycena metata]